MRTPVVLLCLGFLFSGCQKISEYYKRGTTEVITPCRITHYTYDYYENVVNTYFDYNSKGQPIRITYFDEWLPEGQASEEFIYDNIDRLIEHVPDEFIGGKRTYIYEGDSRYPLRDTLEDSYGNKYVEAFEFDYSGRIIRETIQWVVAGEGFEYEPDLFWKEVKNYYYDVHGNRQVNPFDHPWHKTILYSDKPSIYSLHPTWQLIFRDYSRNNASQIKTTNDRGLPVTFQVNDLAYWQPFFDLPMNATIFYNCK